MRARLCLLEAETHCQLAKAIDKTFRIAFLMVHPTKSTVVVRNVNRQTTQRPLGLNLTESPMPLTQTSRSIRTPAFHGAPHDSVPGMADAYGEILCNRSTRKASAVTDSTCVRAGKQPEGVLHGKKNTARWRHRYERYAWFLIL
jgi:hypothetical protein